MSCIMYWTRVVVFVHAVTRLWSNFSSIWMTRGLLEENSFFMTWMTRTYLLKLRFWKLYKIKSMSSWIKWVSQLLSRNRVVSRANSGLPASSYLFETSSIQYFSQVTSFSFLKCQDLKPCSFIPVTTSTSLKQYVIRDLILTCTTWHLVKLVLKMQDEFWTWFQGLGDKRKLWSHWNKIISRMNPMRI